MKSEKVTNIFGDEKTVHYDDYGNKVGESRVEKNIFGDKKTVHYDDYGRKTGESRVEENFFGDKKTVHYDDYGRKTGETRMEKDFFGNEKWVTYDKYGVEKTGEYRDNTPHYGDSNSDSSGGYSGYREDHVPDMTAKDGAWLLSAVVLAMIALMVPFILYIASKNSGDTINLIRTAVTALCPAVTLFCVIKYRAKKTDGEAVRTGKRRMIISTCVLFAAQEAIFLAYTAPAANGDEFSSFLLFVCCWIPKLIYSVVCGIFSRKCRDGGNTCDGCYFFAAKAFAVVAALMETVNVIADGILGEFIAAVIYTVPAALILYGVIWVLSKGTDWIYKKISR